MLFVHSRKILHCDLKSQNILLTESWQVKVCDFGLARFQDRFVKDNKGKIGTPHWMAPEILRGESYTEAADVYSFGVILWEVLTGQIPYKERSFAQITGSVGYHKETLTFPHPDGEGRSSIYHKLKKVVNNCLRFDQAERPTYSHILDYLEKVDHKCNASSP